jgi:5-formyltetrahydrofolate cyclo-ligase
MVTSWLEGRDGIGGGVRTVALFRSAGSEPPTMPLLTYLSSRHLRLVVPWASTAADAAGPGGERWVAWRRGTQAEGETGPIGERGEADGEVGEADAEVGDADGEVGEADAEVGDADAVIVPALAVSRDGTRLGKGGGWYDRVLSHVKPGTPIVAMVNPAELLPAGAIPREPHDVPVHGALLPGGITWFARECRAAR